MISLGKEGDREAAAAAEHERDEQDEHEDDTPEEEIATPRDAISYARRLQQAAQEERLQLLPDALTYEELDYLDRCICDLKFAIMDDAAANDDDWGASSAPERVWWLNAYRCRLLLAANISVHQWDTWIPRAIDCCKKRAVKKSSALVLRRICADEHNSFTPCRKS